MDSLVRHNSVLEEPFLSFHSQLSFSNQAVQQLTLSEESLLGKPCAPPIHDELGRVKTNIVCQLKGSHGVACSQFHGEVDILGTGIATLHQPDRLHEVGHQQPVHNEPRGVLAVNGFLSHCLSPGDHCVEGLVRCLRDSHHFQQLHHRHRGEEVESSKPVQTKSGRCNLGDRQGRGVRGQDGLGWGLVIILCKQLLLQLHIFNDCLDNKVGGLDGSVHCCVNMHVGQRAVNKLFTALSIISKLFLGYTLYALRNTSIALVQNLLTDVNQCDFMTSLSSDLGNASSHQTSTNHHHLFDDCIHNWRGGKTSPGNLAYKGHRDSLVEVNQAIKAW